jgi:hypothetical protein
MLEGFVGRRNVVCADSFLTFFSNRYILKSIQVRPELIVSESMRRSAVIGLQIN